MGPAAFPRTATPPARPRRVAGPVLFARYAYPPNRLGLCGPADAPALHDGAVAGADGELRELARGFEGAFPYLRLIADENGVEDALDPRVVEAYWLGNDLTRRVTPRALHRDVNDRFHERMPAAEWRWLEEAVGAGARPIHAFHVLQVFPRSGLLRGGRPPILDTMDACRIRWGTLVAAQGDQLVVNAPRLEMRNGILAIGPAQAETVTGWLDGSGRVLGGVTPGDPISLHWGWACDHLSAAQLQRLVGWTEAALALANQSI
jgi:hypothetical protein